MFMELLGVLDVWYLKTLDIHQLTDVKIVLVYAGREIICDCTIIHLEITRLQLLFILYGTDSLCMDVVIFFAN